MQVFQPENTLEVIDLHVGIDLLELGCLLIHLEGLLPGFVRHRRQCAEHGPPVDHREPRTGQPGYAAEHDHGKHQRAANQQPGGDLAIIVSGIALHRSFVD